MEAELRGHFRKWMFFAGLAAVITGAAHGASAAACSRMEFAVVDDRGPRTIAEPDGNVLHLKAAPLLTMADFAGAGVTLTENQIVLNVDLDRDGAARIQAFSKANVGARIAFIADGQVIKTAKILDPITFNGFLVGPLDRAKADALAAAINKNAHAACSREP
jgi:preprotein translocase subunit SecD